jgi:hypothetical protein
MHSAFESNPKGFIQILNFHRNIKGGNGIKMYLWLGLCIVKSCVTVDLYKLLLGWTIQYSKDIHNLCRLTQNIYDITTPEIEFYAFRVYIQIIKLLKGDTTDLDLMLFKYLSHKKGHWARETNLIWAKVSILLQSDADFRNLVKDTKPLPNHHNLGEDIRSLFVQKYRRGKFSPELQRKLKVAVNSRLHLTDYLLSGKHYDGTLFDFSPESLNTESEKIGIEISKSASIATAKLCKTINLMNVQTNKTPVQSLLIEGHNHYLELLKAKKVVAKEVGIDLPKLVYNYYITGTESSGLVEQINARVTRICEQVMPIFTSDFTILDFTESFRIIMDRSGSMNGLPLENGLFQLLVMTLIFRMKKVIYFDDYVTVRNISEDNLDGSVLDLIKLLYTRATGCTQLSSVFNYLKTECITNKNIVIITDGDCDPDSDNITSSPFHTVFDKSLYSNLHTCNYIILNVNESKMSFPYLNFHPNVSYINGIMCLDFLIEALIRSEKNSIPLTPSLLLECCLDADRFQIPPEINDLLVQADTINMLYPLDSQLNRLFKKWEKLLPYNPIKSSARINDASDTFDTFDASDTDSELAEKLLSINEQIELLVNNSDEFDY